MTDPKRIGDLFPDYFKSKTAFKKAGGKILNPPVMFINWKALNDKRCPYCGNKLYQTYDRKLYLCRSRKHKKSFAISTAKLTAYPHLYPQGKMAQQSHKT